MVNFDKDNQFVHVREEQITSNWLLNQILGGGKTDYKITKISNDELLKFLKVLDEGNLRMHTGEDSLIWLKNRLAKRHDEAENKLGQNWEDIRNRYRYIVQQIDIILANSKNLKEKLLPSEKISSVNQEQDLKISFVPL